MSIHPERCPLCDGRFAEGILIDHGRGDSAEQANWHDSMPKVGFMGGLKIKEDDLRAVRGYRCQECGYLMLFAF